MITLEFCKALSDSTRLRLVNVLRRRELSVNECMAVFGLGQSRVSHHLKLLTTAGLATCRRDGRLSFYSARSDGPAGRFLACLEPIMAEEASLMADLQAAESVVERRRKETKRFFNSVAADWERMSKEVLGGFALADVVVAALPNVDVAADLGCGPGSLIGPLLTKAQAVIGVDNSPAMLEQTRDALRSHSDRLSLRIGDLEHLPLRDNEADAAIMVLALHHVSDPADALREAFRVIKPGGAFVLVDFERHGREFMRERYGDLRLGFEHNELADLFAQAGFELSPLHREPLSTGFALFTITAVKPKQRS